MLEQLSHYRVLELIGKGGMGEVYLAQDLKLRRKVALKVLPSEYSSDAERKQRFFREARAAAAVEHPNIAAVYDVDEMDGRIFYAMEYVRGENVATAIRTKRLTFQRSLELAAEIADGLGKAHGRGVVHRDLKPENVLVSEEGYAKIVDFGLAKLTERWPPAGTQDMETASRFETSEGAILGTIGYMSPEQVRGEAVDGRTDIFSLGVLLYEMVFGQSPFKRSNIFSTMNAIVSELPPLLGKEVAGIPAGFHRVLRKALAKEPVDRHQKIGELGAELRRLIADLGNAPQGQGEALLFKIRVAVLFVTGLAVMWVLSYIVLRQPPPAGIGASGRPAIAVMVFDDHTESPDLHWLSCGIPNMLLTALAQTPGLDVVSSERIHEIMRELGQENHDAFDQQMVAEIGRRAGAGAVVVGSIYKSGSQIRIDVRLEDLRSGRVLEAERVEGSEPFRLVDDLSTKIRHGLALREVAPSRGITEIT